MSFQPIAIVGQSCVLPGALNPSELWEAVLAGKNLLSKVPEGYWQTATERMLAGKPTPNRSHCDMGGYVRGFEARFDPTGFALPEEEIRALDPLFQWSMSGVREALRDAGGKAPSGTGLILGALNYPVPSMTRFAESVWFQKNPSFLGGRAAQLLGHEAPHPYNRFCSGLPAQLAAGANGLDGVAFTLDAACASSFYAIKLACDQLHDFRADMMIAGAVNRADDLFIHVGFCTLNAMSKRGRSTPFDRDADGLIPSEGAAFVVLKRLKDALADGDRVLGVIRGIGLSNDGRSGGFLAPAQSGQTRAITAAYAQSGVDPNTISLLECHATGTPVGDKVELASSGEIFGGHADLPLGSLKSNLGHLITVAGAAGLQKVLGAFKAGVRPPTINVAQPTEALANGPFRLLQKAEPWTVKGPRRAGINAFGFGGNNAHLIVEEHRPESPVSVAELRSERAEVVIVAMEAATGAGIGGEPFHESLTAAARQRPTLDNIDVALSGLRFPPKDLNHTLPQQILILELARRVAASVSLPIERTSVLIGMGADPEIARYSARWRLDEWAERWHEAGFATDGSWLESQREMLVQSLEAAGVIGTMPNIPANRINAQLDCQGPGFTVSGEELSGLHALEIARRGLAAGEFDAALVGAVDLSSEVVHQSALEGLGLDRLGGDGAVVLVLKRAEDARRDGDNILAVLAGAPEQEAAEGPELGSRFGHAHTADALLRVAASADALFHQYQVTESGALPWLSTERKRLRVGADGLAGGRAEVMLTAADEPAQPALTNPRIYLFSGSDVDDVRKALETDQRGGEGPARLAFLAADEATYTAKKARALTYLGQQPGEGFCRLDKDMFWCSRPQAGELGFVFTGAAAAYAGMGRELLLGAPRLADMALARFPILQQGAHWLDPRGGSEDPFQVLQGCCLMIQLHGVLTRGILGLEPKAVLGMSSGETNAMFVTGAWHDLDGLYEDIERSGMYTQQIAGDYQAAKNAWNHEGPVDWMGYRILAPVAEIEAAVAGEERVHVTMVNAPKDAVIGGEAAACARVIKQLKGYHVLSLGHDIIAHAPEMATWREPWHRIHSRETTPVEGIRFYANALDGAAYEPTAENIAHVLTEQAVKRVDFRKVVEAAYADGVRIFLEHGPRGLCAGWIGDILGDREHLAVALDHRGDGLVSVTRAVAQLLVAGVDVDVDAWMRFTRAPELPKEAGKSLAFNAHPNAVCWSQPPSAPQVQNSEKKPIMQRSDPQYQAQTMAPAPAVPAVLPEGLQTHVAAEAPVAPETQAAPEPARRQVAMEVPPLDPHGTFQETMAVHNQVLEGMRAFHAQMVDTHQAFLAQRERNMARLLNLQPGTMPAETATPPVAPRVPQGAAPAAAARVVPKPAPAPAPKPTPVAAGPVASPAPKTERPLKTPPSAQLPGPKYDRKQLEILASGKISAVLGPLFERQDHFPRQVRMPEPPLLLADRVTGIDAEPGAMGRKATIWTETDVAEDAWYLDRKHMPPGIMIESGQADLLLISYLGADFQNKGERVYRLLGCDLTFKGGMPTVGDTLKYDIHIDGYAEQGPVRLFFFHYDCRIDDQVRLSVRDGQAGFFTDEELAESGGILWDPKVDGPAGEGRLDPPDLAAGATAFSAEQVRAFTRGQLSGCFGAAFGEADAHTATPRIKGGRQRFFDEVTVFDPKGGPWARGYLRAETALAPNEWFYDGHFKNDPCMPGTLMFDGCFQTMAFYLAAMGYTVDRDGWRFEPVPDELFKLRCRGQVIPGAKHLIYEVFVQEVHAGPIPTLYADVLCTVDGLKAFHGARIALRLVPAYPLDSGWRLPQGEAGRTPAAVDGHVFDFDSLAACAWGRPSAAFGPTYGVFDGHRRCPRLPGPPYHFMTRITRLDSGMGVMRSGGTIEAEYDIPADAWYFAENGNRCMPYAVLLEAALQPCGWFASYMGCALSEPEDLFFRNLDGTATQHVDVLPESGTLRTEVKSTSVSKAGSIMIVSYQVHCYLGEVLVFDMSTVFGFFNGAALADQAGLPVSEERRALMAQAPNFKLNLAARPSRYFDGALRLPGPMLQLLDRVVEYSPQGGKAGLGRLRAEADVDSHKWYFKSHFFGDPVQPGSLGLEPMLQLMQFYMLHEDMGKDIEAPRFEAVESGKPMTWKYRGQVTTNRKLVSLEVDILEREVDADGARVTAESSLWVDGLRIYEAISIGMRIVPGKGETRFCESLDPAVDTWLGDHAPTWTVPALPMMSMVDRLAQGALARAPGRKVVGLEKVVVHRWLGFEDGARHLDVIGTPLKNDRVFCQLRMWHEARALFVTIASGEVLLDEGYPLAARPMPALEDGQLVDDPYALGTLFHGKAFQVLKRLRMGANGSSAVLDANPGTIPVGHFNQRLMDGATHAIPHDHLASWDETLTDAVVCYPRSITRAVFHGPAPTSGEVRCEARFLGYEDEAKRFPMFDLQLVHEGRIWAEISMTEVLFPKGPLGEAPPHQRRAFLQGEPGTGVALSRAEGETRLLRKQDLEASNWLQGTLATAYHTRAVDPDEMGREIALKEGVAALLGTHPKWVERLPDGRVVNHAAPFSAFEAQVTDVDGGWRVSADMGKRLVFDSAKAFWREVLKTGPWLGEDVFEGITTTFLDALVLEDPQAFEAIKGRSALFLGNHQTGIESMLFSAVVSALMGMKIPVLAKDAHSDSWIGKLLSDLYNRPEPTDPELLILVNREDTQEVFQVMQATFAKMKAGEHGLMVHVEGTRSQRAGLNVEKMSSMLMDMAAAAGIPVVPLRFQGGLPRETLDKKLEFPLGLGKQRIFLGRPIMPETMAALASHDRRTYFLDALANLGEPWQDEQPCEPNQELAARVAGREQLGVPATQAVVLEALASLPNPSDEALAYLAKAEG